MKGPSEGCSPPLMPLVLLIMVALQRSVGDSSGERNAVYLSVCLRRRGVTLVRANPSPALLFWAPGIHHNGIMVCSLFVCSVRTHESSEAEAIQQNPSSSLARARCNEKPLNLYIHSHHSCPNPEVIMAQRGAAVLHKH